VFHGIGVVTACRLLDPPKELTWDDIGCDIKKHYDMMSISLVNKKFLQQLYGYDEKLHSPNSNHVLDEDSVAHVDKPSSHAQWGTMGGAG
jgi:hypothetical protein